MEISFRILNSDWKHDLQEAAMNTVWKQVKDARDLTPDLFNRYRGSGVKGPHKWEKYWDVLLKSREIYGAENVSVHLISGLGETEKEMAKLFQLLVDLRVEIHLFSFFPEPYRYLTICSP